MNEHRYYDAYAADGYYMSSPIKNGRGRIPSTGAKYAAPSCPSCYRPLLKAGYCDGCTASGAAERHQARRAAPILVVVREPAPSKPRATPRRTPEQRRERLAAAIQAYMLEHNRIPTMSAWRRERMLPAATEAYKVFGSWLAALEAAGITMKGA